MSFTAEVRDELARVEPACAYCNVATLAALVRVCGSITYGGPGHYRLQVATETGAVARTMLGLTHKVLKLKTEFTVRRSVLHKARNYLIVLPDQPQLDKALVLLGVLGRDLSLVQGLPAHLLRRACCRRSYVRGALIAGGFIADPKGDFHLEIAVSGEQYARELADLVAALGVRARVNRRRGSFAVYVKSADDIKRLLQVLGARRSIEEIDAARRMKSVKNDVNRRINAELANQVRTSAAAQGQLDLIDRIERLGLYDGLSPALKSFCELRRAHPELSLRELGAQARPPLSKSALYHRVQRLEKLVADASEAQE